MFQKLEDSLQAYEDVVQAEHNVASMEQLRPIVARAVLDSQTTQEQSARLRLGVSTSLDEFDGTKHWPIALEGDEGDCICQFKTVIGHTGTRVECEYS